MEQREDGNTALPPPDRVSSGASDVEPVAHASAGCAAGFIHSLLSSSSGSQQRPDQCGDGPGEGWVTNATWQAASMSGEKIAHSSLTISNEWSPCCLGCRPTPREQADPGLPDPYLEAIAVAGTGALERLNT